MIINQDQFYEHGSSINEGLRLQKVHSDNKFTRCLQYCASVGHRDIFLMRKDNPAKFEVSMVR